MTFEASPSNPAREVHAAIDASSRVTVAYEGAGWPRLLFAGPGLGFLGPGRSCVMACYCEVNY